MKSVRLRSSGWGYLSEISGEYFFTATPNRNPRGGTDFIAAQGHRPVPHRVQGTVLDTREARLLHYAVFSYSF